MSKNVKADANIERVFENVTRNVTKNVRDIWP